MNTTLTARRETAVTATTIAPAAGAPRLDLYAPIHKALRSFMGDTLGKLGRIDTGDADECRATLAQLDALLALCEAHIAHENGFVHPAIDARRPGAAQATADDHAEHLASIDALRCEASLLHGAGAELRGPLALRLYRHVALFVAENLQHMHHEETANNAALWALYSDAELAAIHDRLLASIAPAEMLLVLRWMVPALTPQERAAMFNAMKTEMPPEAWLGVVEAVRPRLDDRAWGKLASAIGVAQQPGLVHFR